MHLLARQMHDGIDAGAPKIFLFQIDVVRKQPDNVRLGANGLGQARAPGGIDRARRDEIAQRFARTVLLDRNGIRSGSTVGLPWAPAVFMAPCTQCILAQIDAVFVRQQPVDVDDRRHGHSGTPTRLPSRSLGLGCRPGGESQ